MAEASELLPTRVVESKSPTDPPLAEPETELAAERATVAAERAALAAKIAALEAGQEAGHDVGALQGLELPEFEQSYAEAEATLLAAYETLATSEGEHRQTHRVVTNLVELYDAWGKPGTAAEWRAKLPSEGKSEVSK